MAKTMNHDDSVPSVQASSMNSSSVVRHASAIGPHVGQSAGARDPRMVASMCQAAWRGDVGELQRLLGAGASASDCDYDQRTPLHLAACAGSMECVQLLVDAGATLEQDRFGCLPIHDAVRCGHREMANYLRAMEINTLDIKDAAKGKVFGLIIRDGVFSMATVQAEVEYFFNIGLHPTYFKDFSLAEIAHHIHCLIAAKSTALITNSLRIHFEAAGESAATYMTTLAHSKDTGVLLRQYLKESPRDNLLSMVTYLSKKSAVQGGNTPLLVHRVTRRSLGEHHKTAASLLNEDDLQLVSSTRFLRSSSKERMSTYQTIMVQLLDRKSDIVQVRPPDEFEPGTVQVIFAYYNPGGRPYVKEVSQIFRMFDLHPTIMVMEEFANGAVFFDMLLPTSDQEKVNNIVRTLPAVPFLGTIPTEGKAIVDLAMSSTITFEEAKWMVACAKFCFHFYPKDSPEYLELSRRFRYDPEGQAALDELHLKTMDELIQEEKIYEVLVQHTAIVRKAYRDFQDIATGKKAPFYNEDLAQEIRATITDQMTRVILLDCLLKFNAYLRLTNFFRDDHDIQDSKEKEKGIKTYTLPMAMAYRFDGSFLDSANKNLFPEAPYGIYLVVGQGFYGFHNRFRDIARGGIRIVRSRNEQVYKMNASRLYEEAYNLALTQQKKNKDIPEGGSKGAILLAPTHQEEVDSRGCFLGYIDALLDCMLAERCGIHSWLPSSEILFFGPDENTAGFMDIGALRAQRRGYQYWKALTTGKSVRFGGIPHDTYGMTTNSVHRYVVGMLRELGIEEEQCTKVQTGGPDGDLGSNEILLSKDRTIGIVDGSGVLYDPHGLDREELIRLARARIPVSNFTRSKLSDKGFLVLVGDLNITLPDGNVIAAGVDLRDTFHLSEYASADLFVPCGGRPKAVHAGNVKQMFKPDGSAKFKYIVEGANLFFTNDARRVLEAAGVKLFQDASTNKGGVTSSSLEVFAALAMNEKDHTNNMTAKGSDKAPQLYEDYAHEIVGIVKNHADQEFKIAWEEMQKGHKSIEMTEQISSKINFLTDTIYSDLNENQDREIIEIVLRRAIPKVLLNHVGFDEIWQNTPRKYLLSIVATTIAKEYVYAEGLGASEFKFYNYMKSL